MVKFVFGGAGISKNAYFNTVESGNKVLDILLAHNITNLDTARLYAGSEEAIGQLEKRSKFTIDTKWQGGFVPGSVTKENIIANAKDSLQLAGIDQFDVFYIHAPDSTTPIEDTLDGVNEAHKLGIFRRFGLSNFTAKQVEEAHAVASKNGWILPTVYQGNYSPVARHLESLLFPTLKKLNINFYAYSPLAGGFLTKTASDLDAGKGRFNEKVIGGLYSKLYDSPALREVLVKWNEIAEAEGVSKAELAYRWVAFHSKIAGDEANGVIFGASRHEQIEQTTEGFERGKLSDKAVEGIEAIWNHVKDAAPIDNFNQFSHL